MSGLPKVPQRPELRLHSPIGHVSLSLEGEKLSPNPIQAGTENLAVRKGDSFSGCWPGSGQRVIQAEGPLPSLAAVGWLDLGQE